MLGRTPAAQKRQQGQAIVVVALMMAVLLGFVALAVDSARSYDGRRVLQDAVDAAALYAGDSYKAGDGWATAQTNGVTLFKTDVREYSVSNCGAFTTPTLGGAAVTTNCTMGGGITLTVTASDAGPGGRSFTYAAQKSLTVALIQVVGQNPNVTLTASATSVANNQALQPTIVSLASTGCFGVAGASMTITGSNPVVVYGDVVSNGGVSIDAASVLRVAGDVKTRCAPAGPTAPSPRCWQPFTAGTFPPLQYASLSLPPSCGATSVAGSAAQGFRFADPRFPAPDVSGLAAQGNPGWTVNMSPGIYGSNPDLGSSFFLNPTCYFMTPGVYDFPGLTISGLGMVSNELRPPDDTDTFWTGGGANCKGSFAANSASTAPALPDNTYSFWLTSVRTETIGGVPYVRESSPSGCKSTPPLSLSSAHLVISNIAGAQAYNVYGRTGGCGAIGTPGYLGTTTNTKYGAESNFKTQTCPEVTEPASGNCTLDQSTYNLLGNNACLGVAPNAAIPADTCGALMPDGVRVSFRPSLPGQNQARATPPRGDVANYNQCATAGIWVTCPGRITPGAVQVYIPSGCLVLGNADAFLFGGVQYNWVLLHEPAANPCTNSLTGSLNSAFVGMLYTPGATMTITASTAMQTSDFGGLIANNVTLNGASNLSLGLTPDVSPAGPAVPLTG